MRWCRGSGSRWGDARAATRRLPGAGAVPAPAESLAGRPLWLDGYNVLTTVEAALAGGLLLHARDGAYRDMASMHGSYRKVAETQPALEHVGRTAADLGVTECCWYLDRPVSNSGRLKKIMEALAAATGGGGGSNWSPIPTPSWPGRTRSWPRPTAPFSIAVRRGSTWPAPWSPATCRELGS